MSNSVLFLGGKFLNEQCVNLVAKIASKTGCRLMTDTFVSRIRRGEGLPIIEQVPYFAESAAEFLKTLPGLFLLVVDHRFLFSHIQEKKVISRQKNQK